MAQRPPRLLAQLQKISGVGITILQIVPIRPDYLNATRLNQILARMLGINRLLSSSFAQIHIFSKTVNLNRNPIFREI